MPKAVYIHGFAGSIHSKTIGDFRRYYSDIEWCPLEVNHNVTESLHIIASFLSTHSDVEYLIGSSLGGFYVLCTNFSGRKLVVNPVLNPMSSLKNMVGVNKYRGRRENGDVEFKFTMQDLFRFKKYVPRDTPLTLCHYTPHDPVLGEDIKREYQKFFAHSEMTTDLPNHFMNEHYIKHKMGDIFMDYFPLSVPPHVQGHH